MAADGGDGGIFYWGGVLVVCCHADVLPFCRGVCGYGCDAESVWEGLFSKSCKSRTLYASEYAF